MGQGFSEDQNRDGRNEALNVGTASLAKKHVVLIPILVLAGFLRTHKTGGEFFGGDDAYISIKAIQVSHYGDTHMTGPPSSLGLVHSPLSVYLYAVPYLFSPNPRAAQFFTGLMNTVAVGVVYLIASRYFGRRAAIIASALYAVHPHMIFASRVINNAQLGAPLVMLYVFTGLLGYYEDKGWARMAHLPLLSLAGQCHPYTFALAPLSVLLAAHAWSRHPQQRLKLVGYTSLSAAIAVLLLLPWGIGVYQFAQHVDVLQRLQDIPSTGERHHDTNYAGLGHMLGLAYRMERVPDNWSRPVQASITIVGASWLVFKAILHRKMLPGSMIVLGLILVPMVTLIIQVHWVIDYWWASLPNAFLVQGAFLGGIQAGTALPEYVARKRNLHSFVSSPHLKWTTSLLAFALVTSQVADYIYTERAAPPVTLDQLLSAMDDAVEHAKEVDKELIVLLSPGHGGLTWALMREYAFLEHGMKSTLVEHDQAFPLPIKGAVLVGDYDNASRAFLFSSGETIFRTSRLAHLPPADYFSPNLRMLQPLRFSNSTTVHGFFRPIHDSLPRAGEQWTIFMIWQPNSPTPEYFKLFTHIVDEHGHNYAQSDVPGLPAEQWHDSAFFASQLDFYLDDNLPDAGPLYLRFGMYDSNSHAEVINAFGNTTGNTGILQIRGQEPPLASWTNGLHLTQIQVISPIQQGPPITVNATWYATEGITDELHLQWRLWDQTNIQIHESVTDVVSNFSWSGWPTGVFAQSQYDLQVPPDLTPGDYRIELQPISSQNDLAGDPYETRIEVVARDRQFGTPAPRNMVGAIFGGEIEILGYELGKNAHAQLELTLFWRALGYVQGDYKYFVHLWDGGEVVAQFDSVPKEWQYPTSWWAPEEVVSETVVFDVTYHENDEYTLTTGFYNPADGERLDVVLRDGEKSDVRWVILGKVSHE